MFSGYWPWWVGGPIFAVVTVAFWLIERRLFGVTSQYVQVLEPTEGVDVLDKASPEALDAALRAATLAEFGPEAVAEMEAEAAQDTTERRRQRAPLPRAASLLFLCMLPVGGAIGALSTGQWSLRSTLGAVHERVVAHGPLGIVALLAGGLLVGVGVRMAGGCTSGHGLSGCSRLRPASLIATASFFGTGIAVSFLIETIAR